MKLPVIARIDQAMSANFYSSSNSRSAEQFGDIELISVYEEQFLKGNTINHGKH